MTKTPSRGACVDIRDLKARLSHHLDRVNPGKTLVVTKRGRAVARLVPTAVTEVTLPTSVQRLLSEGAAAWSGEGVPDLEPVELRTCAPGTRGSGSTGTLADIVAEDRR